VGAVDDQLHAKARSGSAARPPPGDLEVYDVDDGGFQVYDARARYLPLTWQAPDPRRRWAGQARLGSPQQGQEDRLYDALRRFLPRIGRADLADAPVLDLQAAAQAISDHHGGRSSRPRWRWPWQRGAEVSLLLRTPDSYGEAWYYELVLQRGSCRSADLTGTTPLSVSCAVW